MVFPLVAGLAAVGSLASPSVTVRATLCSIVALLLVPVALLTRPAEGTIRLRAILVSIALCSAAGSYLRIGDSGFRATSADVAMLIGRLLVIGAMAKAASNRRGRGFHSLLVDGAVIAVAVWMLSWVFVANRKSNSGEHGLWIYVLDSAYQPVGAALALLLFAVVFSDSPRSLAVRLLSAAVLCSIAADLLSAFTHGSATAFGLRLSDSLVTLAFGLGAGAIAHGSATTLSQRQPMLPRRPLPGRMFFASGWAIAALIAATAVPAQGSADNVVRAIGVSILTSLVVFRAIQSVLANRRAQDELLSLSQTDQLTGLANRRCVLEHIEAHLCNSWRNQGQPTVLFIDVDRFKTINDSLGHAAGDRALLLVSERFARAIPPRAVVARLSGDEFVVFDPDSPSPQAALQLADQLLATLHEPLALATGDVFVTASIGVCEFVAGSRPDAGDLLRDADTAMYRAKELGRNRVALFDSSMHERVAHRMNLETALYRALDRRELCLFHQPILNTRTGEIIGFEALMRWQREDGSIVSPAEFIPIAEETGTIISIGSWALGEALAQLRRWIDEGVCAPTTTMSVNVSPQQLIDPRFPEKVNEAVLRSRISPHLLWLEITEGVMISQPALALSSLRRLPRRWDSYCLGRLRHRLLVAVTATRVSVAANQNRSCLRP